MGIPNLTGLELSKDDNIIGSNRITDLSTLRKSSWGNLEFFSISNNRVIESKAFLYIS